FAGGIDAHHALLGIGAVLAQNNAATGADRHVVGVDGVAHGAIGFLDQGQNLATRVIAEHLPLTSRATVGGDEVDVAAVIPAAFTPAEGRATQSQTTVVAASLFRRGDVDPLGVPGHALGEAWVLSALAA